MTCEACNDTRSITVFGPGGAQHVACEACLDTPAAIAEREQGPSCAACGCPKVQHGARNPKAVKLVAALAAAEEELQELRAVEPDDETQAEIAALEVERDEATRALAKTPGWLKGCAQHDGCQEYRGASA